MQNFTNKIKSFISKCFTKENLIILLLVLNLLSIESAHTTSMSILTDTTNIEGDTQKLLRHTEILSDDVAEVDYNIGLVKSRLNI